MSYRRNSSEYTLGHLRGAARTARLFFDDRVVSQVGAALANDLLDLICRPAPPGR